MTDAMKPDADGMYRFDVLMPTEEQIREQMRTMFEGPPVYCFLEGYPPLPDERSIAYRRRVMPLVMRDMHPPKRSVWQMLLDIITG